MRVSKVKEHPLLMSGPLVLASLDDRKTQTRRVITEAYKSRRKDGVKLEPSLLQQIGVGHACRLGAVGDRLWVREMWCQKIDGGYFVYNSEGNLDSSCCWYRATNPEVEACDDDGGWKFNKDGSMASPWSPSIYMPRWACRLVLEITELRVERLQEINNRDCVAEGLLPTMRNETPVRERFRELWDSINAKRGYGWETNPWVWAISYKRVRT